MKYMGSKRRIANDIISVIFNIVEVNKDTIFYDVFCGGGNLIEAVPLKNRIGIDLNEYMVEALRVIKLNPNILPKNETDFVNMVKQYTNDPILDNATPKEVYNYMRKHADQYPKWLIGFICSTCAYGGKFMSTYARGLKHSGEPRDFVGEAYRSALNQHKLIQCVDFICKEYDQYDYIKENSIIYCDPPYNDVSQYRVARSFDHDRFYNWVTKMSNEGYNIFFSEFSAPSEFIEIWSKEILITVHRQSYKTKVDRLFTTQEVLDRNRSLSNEQNIQVS